jgi:hypothetical protein
MKVMRPCDLRHIVGFEGDAPVWGDALDGMTFPIQRARELAEKHGCITMAEMSFGEQPDWAHCAVHDGWYKVDSRCVLCEDELVSRAVDNLRYLVTHNFSSAALDLVRTEYDALKNHPAKWVQVLLGGNADAWCSVVDEAYRQMEADND